MIDEPARDDATLDAGPLGPWVVGMQAALRGERDADVPCDGCTACCTASQFVHIAPDETDTLGCIPSELRFPAPRLPRGHVVLGYDERGHCPMLVDGACSIYDHRPRACRTYDCRVFAATGVELDEREKAEIMRRVRRWRFRVGAADAPRAAAVRDAAAFLRDHGGELPSDLAPTNPTARAVAAVAINELFLDGDHAPKADAVTVALARTRPERS